MGGGGWGPSDTSFSFTEFSPVGHFCFRCYSVALFFCTLRASEVFLCSILKLFFFFWVGGGGGFFSSFLNIFLIKRYHLFANFIPPLAYKLYSTMELMLEGCVCVCVCVCVRARARARTCACGRAVCVCVYF